jgi:hypothetical protein
MALSVWRSPGWSGGVGARAWIPEHLEKGKPGMKWVGSILLLVVACGSAEEAYLKAFPVEDYEVVTVPGVGRFYLDDNPGWVKGSCGEVSRWRS